MHPFIALILSGHSYSKWNDSASSTAAFTGAASSQRIAVSSATSSAIITASALGFQDDPKFATDSFHTTSTATVHRIAHATASDSATLTVSASEDTIVSYVYRVSTTGSFFLSDSAKSNRIAKASASDSAVAIGLSLPQNPSHDSATFSDLAQSIMDLGRFRRGDWIPIAFTLPAIPDAIPVAVILDSNSDTMASLMVPAVTPDRLTYLVPYQVNSAYSVGNFSVYLHYVVAGSSILQQASFEVVAGGDSGGSVISLYSIDRPEVRSIVAQLDSGVLVLGRSPQVME